MELSAIRSIYGHRHPIISGAARLAAAIFCCTLLGGLSASAGTLVAPSNPARAIDTAAPFGDEGFTGSFSGTLEVGKLIDNLDKSVRFAIEFDLAGLPGGSAIDSATFSIRTTTQVGSSTDLRVGGYAGDGTVDLSDLAQTSTTLLGSKAAGQMPTETVLTFDVTAFIQSLAAGEDAGFLFTSPSREVIGSGTLADNASFSGTGSAFAPSLEINFTESVPEPSALALAGLALVGLSGARLRRRRCARGR